MDDESREVAPSTMESPNKVEASSTMESPNTVEAPNTVETPSSLEAPNTTETPSTTNFNGCEITYKDFLPANDGHAKPSYESFRTLVTHANKWLKRNTQWKVRTCETMEFSFNCNNEVATSKMVYVKDASSRNVRALRLWLQRFPPGEKKEQEIGYINLIPKTTRSASSFSYGEFERLGDIVKRFNEQNQSKPIPGRIITIETQAYKVIGNGVVDPEFTAWNEQERSHIQFVYIIRIFYEVGEPMMEKIGFQDFIPNTTSDSCFPICRKYDGFSDMTYKASRWCLRQTNITVCTSQFLVTKLVETSTPDSTKMSYVRHGVNVGPSAACNAFPFTTHRRLTAFLRILRVAFIRLKPDVRVPFAKYTCKSFIPVLLKPGVCMDGTHPQFETLTETLQRASDWIKENNANVLSLETFDGQLYSEGSAYSSEMSYHTVPSLNREKYYFYIVRVYLDGEYGDEADRDDVLMPAHACCCSIQ